MASTSQSKTISKFTYVDITINKQQYKNVKLYVLENLCVDVILGLAFQKQHESVTFKFGGEKPPIEICGLATLNVEPPDLFGNLLPNCKPVATKSRRYSQPDRLFIRAEKQRLFREDIIEPSTSPWRAQVVVTKDNENHKKRLVVDYSQTINKFTQLDAYPLPRIDEFVNKIAQYKVFSSIDLKSAYHQVPLKEEDKIYTAFEADGELWQFKRMPPGVTNGGSCFQRSINNFIEREGIPDTFAYLDNLYVCGNDDIHHDNNLAIFETASKKYNLTYNENKCSFKTRKLDILGSVVEEGTIRSDPERLRPLMELPCPHDAKSLKRVLGFFSHYSQWIPHFSDKVAPLLHTNTFPLDELAVHTFEELKLIIQNSVVASINESLPFEVECDASDLAVAGVLSQRGLPVAFFSRTFHASEKKWPIIEKEACAIIESIRHWKHFLTGRSFILKTDQKSVSYIFDSKHKGKIKNDKLYRWRLELSCYSFDIVYQPGPDNVAPDTFTRTYCAAVRSNSLSELHNALCHPGITRLTAYVRSKNLPYSVEEIRSMSKGCRVCCECKPKFYRPTKAHLIKATQPMERLNLDFKGPLPSRTQNKYLLTIVDEYSRYPFAIPCQDVSAATVNTALCHLFSMFGLPAYIHSDRGSAFMSEELRSYLHDKGIATSRTTPYNPQGNGLVERYNGTIWKTVTLALKSRNLPAKCWDIVLPDALHSIRSLISTSINCTPHERMFNFQRRTSSGMSLPSWLSSPGPVLLRKFVRQSKYEPLVDEVELVEANPQYAHVRFPNGRESTVSIRDLAPSGNVESTPSSDTTVPSDGPPNSPFHPYPTLEVPETTVRTEHTEIDTSIQTGTPLESHVEAPPFIPRRSKRVKQAPDRLDL